MNQIMPHEVPSSVSKWKQYPAYEDSGVGWLGHIPERWEVAPLKRGFEVQLGKMLQNEPASSKDTLEPYLRAANIAWDGVDMSDVKEMWFSPWEKLQFGLTAGDLLVSEGGDVGRSALWKGELQNCYIQNAINRVRSKGEDTTSFLYYWMYSLKHLGLIDILCSKATISHFTAEKVKEVPVILPPVPEQESIVAFLDRETAKIDVLVKKKERLIELLQEKRTAIISQAVTKGLDPSVQMKDSDVKWLGKIPAHWEVKRLKFLTANPLQYGANEAGLLADLDQPRFVRITDITESGELREDTFRSLPHDVAQPFLLSEGDLLLARSGATVGKSFMYKDSWGVCCYAGYLIRARLNKSRALSEFISYFASSRNYWDWIFSSLIQATIQNVSAEKYASLFLGVPPITEQQTICDYLDRETTKIDALVAKVCEGIEKLKEYRTALISAAVTGKIDVREETAFAS